MTTIKDMSEYQRIEILVPKVEPALNVEEEIRILAESCALLHCGAIKRSASAAELVNVMTRIKLDLGELYARYSVMMKAKLQEFETHSG
jgi:hypothetical protein